MAEGEEKSRPRLRLNVNPGSNVRPEIAERMSATASQIENEINAMVSQWLRGTPKDRAAVLRQIGKLATIDAALYVAFLARGLPTEEANRLTRGLIAVRLAAAVNSGTIPEGVEDLDM